MERIHVAVRARPLSAEDAGSSPWRIAGNAIALSAQASTLFEFDRIFGEECRTADVYGARTKRIVDSAVRGFNGTVFAYGQTNSGKTYTMRGSANEPGIIPLAVHDLFQSIQELQRNALVAQEQAKIANVKLSALSAIGKSKQEASTFNKEKMKLRMQIRCMQPELDAHRGRLKEAMNEMKLMGAKYHEASTKLKKDLSYSCREVLRLREGLKESQDTSS